MAVVGERARGIAWSVHADVDADDVSSRLEQHRAYPLDLDAVGRFERPILARRGGLA
jgi:hypothetical protein